MHLTDGARGRPQHLERGQDHFRRHIADAVDEAIDIEIAPVGEIRKQLHLAEIDRRGEADQILHRPVVEDRAVQQRQHATEAIADHGDVGLAGILLHAADAIRNEIEDVVLHPQRLLFRPGRGPVQHVDVVAALEEKFDKTLARHHIEDVAAIGGRHHDQDRHPIDLVGDRPIVIQIHRAADVQDIFRCRSERRARRGDIFDTLDAALDRALNLGLDPFRDRRQIEGRET